MRKTRFPSSLIRTLAYRRGLRSDSLHHQTAIQTLPAAVSVLVGSQPSPPSSSSVPHLLAASLGLVAATALSLYSSNQNSHCQASNRPEESSDPSTIKAFIHDVWLSIDQQLHRLDAGSSTQIPRLPQPEIDIISPERVAVSFKIPQALDITGAIHELRRLLRSPKFSSGAASWGSSVSEEMSSGVEGRSIRFQRSSEALKNLTVDVLLPFDSSRPATFEFQGPPTLVNLQLMADVMNKVAHLTGSSHDKSSSNSTINPLQDLQGQMMRQLFDTFFNEFEHLELEDGPDTALHRRRRPHVPKHFDDFPSIDGYPRSQSEDPNQKQQGEEQQAAVDAATAAAVKKLTSLGAQVFLPSSNSSGEPNSSNNDGTLKVDWGSLAGYEEQKQQIEDSLLLPLLRPDVYDKVAKGTRARFSSNRPRAILMVGPPGTGKTSSARIIAAQACVPLVYLPLEALVSKWYGESEKQIAEALAACDALSTGCVVFLDEIDALATTRATEMHEATRRVLGVLLRHLDGFDSSRKSVVVGATNRPQDLDPALLSRFSTTIEFGLPDEACRREILRQYAHQLSDAELKELAGVCSGMAGRDLRDICELAERTWAAKIVRGQVADDDKLPGVEEYRRAAKQRVTRY